MIKKLSAAILLALFFLTPLQAATNSDGQFSVNPQIDAAWMKGLDYMYRLDFDRADTEFKRLIAAYPDHPAGYLALAGLQWWILSQNFDNVEDMRSYETEFFAYIDEAEKRSRALMKNKQDDTACFCLGVGYGLVGRWYAVKRRWWKAYTNGSNAKIYLRKTLELNPNAHDAALGLGIMDYYADTLPSALKLMSAIFIHGDKERGLKFIDQSINKGRFFVTEANLFKISIYLQFEKKYAEAIAMAQALEKKQPDNDFFRFVEVVTRFNANDWPGTLSSGLAFINEHKNDRTSQLGQQLALVYLAVGDAYFMAGDRKHAIEYFSRGIEDTAYPGKGWITFCHLRLAQMYDLEGLRDKAIDHYLIAASRPDFFDSEQQARAGLRKPYTEEGIRKEINNAEG